MNVEDVKVGIYRLTQDVPNKHVDKRVKNDWRAKPVNERGTLFYACFVDEILTIHAGPWTHQAVNVLNARHIIDYLEPVEVGNDVCNLCSYMRHCEYKEFSDEVLINALQSMVDEDLVTIDDVRSAIERAYEATGD